MCVNLRVAPEYDGCTITCKSLVRFPNIIVDIESWNPFEIKHLCAYYAYARPYTCIHFYNLKPLPILAMEAHHKLFYIVFSTYIYHNSMKTA